MLYLFAGSAALDSEWHDARDGDWRYTNASKNVIRQSVSEVRADLLKHISEPYNSCFRTWVEMSPSSYRAGMWIGRSENPVDWLMLVLDGQYEGRGFALLDSAGSVLWEDPWVEWVSYTPYLLEAVFESGRVRVQMFGLDGPELLSQSDWIAIPVVDSPAQYFGFHTDRAIARFQGWEVAPDPVSPVVPDAPNRLRLVDDSASEWRIVGHGKWAWSSPERLRLRQSAAVERTSAVYLGHPQSEGVWRTVIRIGDHTGGAGLLYRTGESADQGFSAWLGGTPGAGALMLYTLSPVEALWTSEQNLWRYDTAYLLEARVEDGQTRARLLSEDGGVVIAESPAFPVPAGTPNGGTSTALQTWNGTAQFSPIQFEAVDSSPGTMPETSSPLLEGWSVLTGEWMLSEEDEGTTLRAVGAESPARVISEMIAGTKGTWTCTVTAEEGTRAIGLLFQADPNLDTGFLLRVTDSEVALNSLDGKSLWRQPLEVRMGGRTLVLEGIVATDRIRVRVTDNTGVAVAESSDCYVTDTNNDRTGYMGFECEGGIARFSNWTLDAIE